MNYSVLEDRILRWDGKSIVEPAQVGDLLLAGVKPSQIIATELSEEVRDFNMMSDDPVLVYDESDEVSLDFTWKMPEKYKTIDLLEYFAQFITPENEARVVEELEIVQQMKIENEIRLMIYIVDYLTEKQIVWGVGRGSSCASYLLYLIGIHRVDCIKYNIPWQEFYH